MKDLLQMLLREAVDDLSQMKKERMLLSDRIKLEKAMLRIQTVRDMIYKLSINPTP